MNELDDAAVLDTNRRFYHALEKGDLPAMVELWLHAPEVVCTHPGRKPVRGWDEVLTSWQAIFVAGGNPQIIVTDEHVGREGPMAWVTATENLLSEGQAAAATALNLFVFRDGNWQLVAHHASPIIG